MTLRFVEGSPRLACEVVGEGPPVVFLHGIGGNRTNWAEQLRAVAAAGCTAIAWDARGYGDSEDGGHDFTFSTFGDDLARFLGGLGIERAHLVGLSMGARILMDFAPRYRHLVATLTLCDCFYGFDNALSPDKQREYIELRERPLREGKTFADLAPHLVASLVSPECPPEIQDVLRTSIEALRVEPYLRTLRASTSFNQADTLHTLDLPVRLIFGEADQLTPPRIGHEMLEKLPDADMVVVPGAGHLSNLEAADAFNDALVEFLEPHRDQAGFAD